MARHSIATSHVPLLPSVPSASQLPSYTAKSVHSVPNIDLNAAIEYHKSTADHLRQIHDNDRKAWDIEKSSLLARIADLELKLNRAKDPKRRSSNDSSLTSAQSFRSSLASSHSSFSAPRNGIESLTSTHPPVWQGPETTPPVTRVFSHDDDVKHLPSISEDETMPSLSKQVSPTHKEEPISIPIEQIDKELDGITVKSTGPAVTSSFIKINSPPLISPNHTPSPLTQEQTPNNGLRVEMGRLLSPLDEKLKRHAGHTPMTFDGTLSTEQTTETAPSPIVERPLEPAPTKRPPLRPSENSDSYFSFTSDAASKPVLDSQLIPEEAIVEGDEDAAPPYDPEEDPALKGPLMLDPSARTQAANDFLLQVDAKLQEAADHENAEDGASGPAEEETLNGEQKDKPKDDDFPQLKIRKSTNFGSAWGGNNPGKI
jgi:hypothetical protein